MSKILVVEDDKSIREELVKLLDLKGYEVEEADCVLKAKEIINKGKTFDLYLIDVLLGDGNGFDVCKYIRSWSDTPIIFLTSVDDEESVAYGLDIGGDDYIVKPFRISELISRIQANLRRARMKGEYRDGMLSNTINIPDNLTPIERELLEILMINKGLIVKRNVLLEKLWDNSGNFVEDNTLTVAISRLKTKLKNDDYRMINIETIRGIGYRLI